jgi:hypothetical protein
LDLSPVAVLSLATNTASEPYAVVMWYFTQVGDCYLPTGIHPNIEIKVPTRRRLDLCNSDCVILNQAVASSVMEALNQEPGATDRIGATGQLDRSILKLFQ